MANDCWNNVIIRGDEETLKELHKRFTSTENGVFNLNNYKNLFDSDVSDMTDEDDWGSKRFTPECEIVNGNLHIFGDSAWTPMEGLFETICCEWGVEGELNYEEQGYDFAGKVCWDSKGIITNIEEWTYWERMYLFETNNFWEEMTWRHEIYESFDEFVQDFNLNKWKDSSILDISKLKEMWDKYKLEQND